MTLLSFLFKRFIGIHTTWKRLMRKKNNQIYILIAVRKKTPFKKWDHQDDNYSYNLRNEFSLEKHWDHSCLLVSSCWVRSCTHRKQRWHLVLSLDLCRDWPFVSLSRPLAAEKASCLNSPASLSSPAQKLGTFPFFNTHFEGTCTFHTWGPSAIPHSTGYSCNTLQEHFSICQPV